MSENPNEIFGNGATPLRGLMPTDWATDTWAFAPKDAATTAFTLVDDEDEA